MYPRDANASKNDKRPFNLNLDKRTKCWQVCEGLVLTVDFFRRTHLMSLDLVVGRTALDQLDCQQVTTKENDIS